MQYSITEKTVQRLLNELEQAIGDLPNIVAEEWLGFVIICCERTRDIRLFGAPPNSVNSDLTLRIADVFDATYQAIKGLDLEQVPSKDGMQIQEYAQNILGRTMLFRELATTAAHVEIDPAIQDTHLA